MSGKPVNPDSLYLHCSCSSAYIFFGGILLLVGGVMEFILANTFTAVVFMTFGKYIHGGEGLSGMRTAKV